MATKPTKLPQWAALSDGSDNDIVDGVSGKNNVVEPTLGQKESGWTFKQFPPRQFFNWLARLTFQWLKYVDDTIDQELKQTSSPRFVDLTINGGILDIQPGGSIALGDPVIGTITEDGSSIVIAAETTKGVSITSDTSLSFIASGGSAHLRGPVAALESAAGGLVQLNSNDGTYEVLFLPTSAPAQPNRLWNDGGTLKITS